MAASPRVGSAVVVADEAGRVLLGMRAKDPNRGQWVFPGGGVRAFESLREAGRREAAEETGLDVELDEEAFMVREIIRPPDEHRLIVFSLARRVGGSLRAGADLEEARFVAGSELASLDLSDVTRDVLMEYLA